MIVLYRYQNNEEKPHGLLVTVGDKSIPFTARSSSKFPQKSFYPKNTAAATSYFSQNGPL